VSAPAAGDGLLWYTRARRIPRLVGKLPGSERGLPFGPYTITQVVGAGITFILLTNTTSAWGRFGFAGNLAVQAGVTFAVAMALRLVKSGGRDPLTAALSLLQVWTAPRFGRRSRNHPVAVRTRVRVLVPDGVDVLDPATELLFEPVPSDAVPVDEDQPACVRPAVQARAATNLERLLAAGSTT